MSRRAWWPPSAELAHAARVALVATVLIAIGYAGCAAVLDQIEAARLTAAVDARLRAQLEDERSHIGLALPPGDEDDAPPVYFWLVTRARSTALTVRAPELPLGAVPAAGKAVTAQLRRGPFRLVAQRHDSGRLVAGQSLAEQNHIESVLADAEAIAGPVFLIVIFLGSLVIGLRALAPVQRSRQRQLEFAADASHELRTPLSVITAETSVALSAPRPAAAYREAIERISGEARRLAVIVEDLLWLARLDARPRRPAAEPIDAATVVATCADRFTALARSGSFEISVICAGPDPAWISAPAEWLDRLTGVLLDNACRYAGAGGTVRVRVAARGSKVTLTVEDSGPGIPEAERAAIFDRFHRSARQGGGAGLGLAIADSIARATGGQWRIGDSPLGGALFEISWRRLAAR